MAKAKAPKATDELRQLLRVEKDRLGTKRAMAEAIGVTEGRMGRVLKGENSLSERSCLRFAKSSGLSASQVLRAAGKADIADLIEELYAITDDALSSGELEFIRAYRRLTAKRQALVRDTVATMAGEEPAAGTKRKR